MAIATAKLKVVERVGSAFGERDAVMNLEPLASTTTDAHPIACVHLLADLAPLPARCDLASRLPVITLGATAGAVAAGTGGLAAT
jgi:hypothetical protein